jgi:peptide/nickel transport system permease protein
MSRSLAVGAILVALIALLGLAAPVLSGYGPIRQLAGENLLGPSLAHPLGTDELDRDVWARVLYGIRTSLTVSVLAVPIGAAVGIGAGLLAAAHRLLDVLASRLFDVVLAFPALILAIAVTALRGPGVATVITAVAIAEIPVFGRITRAEAIRLGDVGYVESARLAGGSTAWVLTRHVLPNSLRPLAVQAALSLSLAVFVESGMSFAGVGVRPPRPSLGSILATAVDNWDANPAYALGPLVAISVLCLGLLLMARGFERGHD